MKIHNLKRIVFVLCIMNIFTIRLNNPEEDLVIKFSNKPDYLHLDKMEHARMKVTERMNFLKQKVNSTLYSLDYITPHNVSINQNHSKLEIASNDVKLIEKERIVKFYIGETTGCHVEVNDTILYDTNRLKSPVEHLIIPHQQNDYIITPKGVYSSNVDIEYFGFSKEIKTFSTYFQTKNNSNDNQTAMEYLYEVRNLIKSFSDFRNDASYDNITNNYNLININFQNFNSNNATQKLIIEFYFDLGEKFVNESTKFSHSVNKTVFTIPSEEFMEKNKTIVKFETHFDLLFNETQNVQVRIPLYFENCKNYKLNTLYIVTGFFLIAFVLFVIYRTIHVIMDEDKDEN